MQTPFISIDEEVAKQAPAKGKAHQDIQVQPAPAKGKAPQDIQVQPAPPPPIPAANIFQAPPPKQKRSLQTPTVSKMIQEYTANQQAPPQIPANQQNQSYNPFAPISTSQQNQYNNLFTQCLKTHDKWDKQNKSIKDLEDRVRNIETQIMKMQKKRQKAFGLIRYLVEDFDS